MLPAPPTTIRDFPRGDTLALFTEVYDNQTKVAHRVAIKTSVIADDGKVVYTAGDERKSDELQGAKGGYGYSAAIETKGLAPGRYVLRVEAETLLTDGGKAKREVEFRVRVTSDIQTIARGDASRILQAQRAIARNDEDWRALWAAHAGPSAVAPPVDFVARMVAAVFQGQRSSAGFETTIVDARAEGDVMTVQVDEHPPAAGRAVAHVLVSPFHIVSLPRAEGEVRFEDVYRHANEVTQAGPRPKPAGCHDAAAPGVLVDRARAGDRRRPGLPCGTAVRRALVDPGAHESLCSLPRLAGAARIGRAGSRRVSLSRAGVRDVDRVASRLFSPALDGGRGGGGLGGILGDWPGPGVQGQALEDAHRRRLRRPVGGKIVFELAFLAAVGPHPTAHSPLASLAGCSVTTARFQSRFQLLTPSS